MDRRITHVGQIPLAEDWLQPQQDAMVSLGALAQAIFGGEPAVIGLTVGPTQPATMAVTVGSGAIYQASALEPTAYGVLPADLTSIVKQGLQNVAVTLPVVAPATAGHSRSYLVQAAFSEEDTDAVLLPYFNSANPAQAYSGPNNNGQRQNTRRRGRVIIQMKAGAPSPTGTQVPPSADVGFIGLAIITVANGATSVSQGAIQSLQSVPRPPSSLLRLRPGFSEAVVFTTPGSTTNWVVPSGVRRARVRLWGGGGGGGGGGPANSISSGGGGYGGGYCEAYLDLMSGQVIPISVGAAGSAGAREVGGGNGGTSSFGSILSATGGQGGAPGTAQNAGNNAGRQPGSGFGGSIVVAGTPGGSGVGWSSPNGLVYGGGEGGGAFGTSIVPRGIGYSDGGAGLVGNRYGGGGGGAVTTVGGAGAQGAVVVEF